MRVRCMLVAIHAAVTLTTVVHASSAGLKRSLRAEKTIEEGEARQNLPATLAKLLEEASYTDVDFLKAEFVVLREIAKKQKIPYSKEFLLNEQVDPLLADLLQHEHEWSKVTDAFPIVVTNKRIVAMHPVEDLNTMADLPQQLLTDKLDMVNIERSSKGEQASINVLTPYRNKDFWKGLDLEKLQFRSDGLPVYVNKFESAAIPDDPYGVITLLRSKLITEAQLAQLATCGLHSKDKTTFDIAERLREGLLQKWFSEKKDSGLVYILLDEFGWVKNVNVQAQKRYAHHFLFDTEN